MSSGHATEYSNDSLSGRGLAHASNAYTKEQEFARISKCILQSANTDLEQCVGSVYVFIFRARTGSYSKFNWSENACFVLVTKTHFSESCDIIWLTKSLADSSSSHCCLYSKPDKVRKVLTWDYFYLSMTGIASNVCFKNKLFFIIHVESLWMMLCGLSYSSHTYDGRWLI